MSRYLLSRNNEPGIVLVATMLLMVLLLTLLGSYFAITAVETASVRHSKSSTSGFYSAEAGLNLRAEIIRRVFVGFNRPTGASPTATDPCTGSNNGSGDFACTNYSFNKRAVSTYVEEDPGNPVILTIPPGERYQYLNAQEYRYTAKSLARNNAGRDEADLELVFKSRLVPLFQFAAFYNKDLEILPGPTMTLSGPVHTNGDLYLYSNSATLTVSGQVTTAGDLYRGRKDGSVSPNCNNREVRIYNPLNPVALIPVCPSRYRTTASDIAPWNGMIQTKVQQVTVPGPEVFDPTPGQVYWDKADLRIVMNLNGSEAVQSIEAHTAADAIDAAATAALTSAATCPGVVAGGRVMNSATFYSFREGQMLRVLDIDVRGLLNCLRSTNWFGTGKQLDDQTEGGLVMHFTVRGPNSSSFNRYAVRLRNGQQLQASAGTPTVRGFTLVSDQAVFVMGDFNAVNKIPAAVMADSINVLSNAWNDANCTSSGACGIGGRVASNTTINSAVLAATDVTGGVEGSAGQGGAYNGGLENYPRFHENWSGRVLVYRGSFVSLGVPRHVHGAWSAQSYNPPNRDWNYDTSFNNAANLPPITPRFVYLRQELFVRDFHE